MTDPDLIFTRPIVSGSGATTQQNCSVELLGLAVYGDMRHGYDLPCIDRPPQRAVVAAQDRLSDEARNSRRWRLIIARLALCHRQDSERFHRRLALWAARSVEHLGPPQAKACNDVLERWLDGDASDEELREARIAAATAAANAYATAAATYAAAAYAATYAATSAAAHAAAYAATAADVATADDVLIDWVDRYLDAWAKIAADEGLLAPDDEREQEYVAFVEALDRYTPPDSDGEDKR